MDLNSSIEELTKNNDMPSDVVVDEVKDMLRKPLSDLDDIDIESQSLEQRLADLRTRRTEAQKWLTPYQSILSPIRRLPTDMLGEIFYHCLPTDRKPIIDTKESPLLLTRICSKWRAVAIADSRLWTRLYITFSDDDMIPVGDADGVDPQSWTVRLLDQSKQRAAHVLRTRIYAVKEWLSRSGSRPLSITLKLTTNSIRPQSDLPYNDDSAHALSITLKLTTNSIRPQSDLPYNDDSAHDLTLELFKFLASISPRFEELELNMTVDMYLFLENMLVVPEMKMLTCFRADYQIHNGRGFGRQERWGIPFAPNLQKISLSGGLMGLWEDRRLSHNWSRLTHITCDQLLSVSQFADFLKWSPNLISFRADIGYDGGEPTPTHEISLPYLRYLHLGEYIDLFHIGKVYEAIDAPSLYWVTYTAQFNFAPHPEAEVLTRIPIRTLLSKSTALRKLTFNAHDIATWRIDLILRSVPMITHLAIGIGHRSSGSPQTTHAIMRYRIKISSWDIGGLLVEHRSDAETYSPLLPNLESLNVSVGDGYFSDETLKDFVISRLGPSSIRGTKQLTHVGVTFNREKEIDAEGEIRRHADLVGATIDLNLNYFDLHNPEPRVFSPAYGLGVQNSQSWIPRRNDSEDPEFSYSW